MQACPTPTVTIAYLQHRLHVAQHLNPLHIIARGAVHTSQPFRANAVRCCSRTSLSLIAMAAQPNAAATLSQEELTWQGSDEFSMLDDRQDLPPLPLPAIQSAKRVFLVRHGQSTWNAEGRIQGCSNFAVLTPKGQAQAQTTRQMLQGESFDMLFHSPLARASETAAIVWGNRTAPVHVLPCLREVDLYSFQGLLKHEGKARYGEQYRTWQQVPAEFIIDGHPPVREMWYRGSLAWQHILRQEHSFSCGLLVAHNAINQALIATALGLPPTYFRRMVQNNAATSVLHFEPTGMQPPHVTLQRLNQPAGRLGGSSIDAGPRLVLVCAPPSDASTGAGPADDAQAAGWTAQVASELSYLQVHEVITSPQPASATFAKVIADAQAIDGFVASQFVGLEASSMADYASWHHISQAWQQANRAAVQGEGRTVAVVGDAVLISGLICCSLGLLAATMRHFQVDPGSVSIIDFDWGEPTVQCINCTGHLEG